MQTLIFQYERQCRIKGVLGVLQHPGPQFWGPEIGVSGKFLCVAYN